MGGSRSRSCRPFRSLRSRLRTARGQDDFGVVLPGRAAVITWVVPCQLTGPDLMVTAPKTAPAERRARGRNARNIVSRSAQSRWDRPAEAAPALVHLQAQEPIRVK